MRHNYLLMQIIIDAGSTKMEWIFLDGNAVRERFTTEGFNPNYAERQCLRGIIESAMKQCIATQYHEIQSVHYYGTGCGSESNCQLVEEVLRQCFPQSEFCVTHDLMAACHALFGHEKGIACILGTGSNSCQYDGERITNKAVSLGYLVGDEGSGMHIGREVVRTYFYGIMPEGLRREFDEAFHLELKDFISHLYHKDQPSRYLATFAKFAGEHKDHLFIRDLVKGCFKAFIDAFILRYEDCKTLRISFIGSVALHFRELLKESLAEQGLLMGEVMQTPAEGLIKYYGVKL